MSYVPLIVPHAKGSEDVPAGRASVAALIAVGSIPPEIGVLVSTTVASGARVVDSCAVAVGSPLGGILPLPPTGGQPCLMVRRHLATHRRAVGVRDRGRVVSYALSIVSR